jgi:hypothetical protein
VNHFLLNFPQGAFFFFKPPLIPLSSQIASRNHAIPFLSPDYINLYTVFCPLCFHITEWVWRFCFFHFVCARFSFSIVTPSFYYLSNQKYPNPFQTHNLLGLLLIYHILDFQLATCERILTLYLVTPTKSWLRILLY